MLNERKFKQIYDAQTSVCKKVYDAVPIQGVWAYGQICGEVIRGGSNIGTKMVQGCLDTLVANGLIREAHKGHFQREPVRTKKNNITAMPVIWPVEDEKEEAVVKQEVQKKPSTPIEHLAELQTLATDVTQQALKLIKVSKLLEERIQEVAVNIDDQFKDSEAKYAKMRQLQSLLKELETD